MKKFVNCLTLIRVFATFLLPIMWTFFKPATLIVVVALILLTDFFDGMLARKFHVQTLFGSIMDSVADKMFGIVIVLILATHQPLFYLIVIFEILIALINVIAAALGALTKSSFLGKFKMWLLGITTLFGIVSMFENSLLAVMDIEFINNVISLFIENEESIIFASVFITAGSEIMVAVDYARRIIKDLRKNKKKIKYDFKSDEELKKALFDTDYYLKNKEASLSKHLLKK